MWYETIGRTSLDVLHVIAQAFQWNNWYWRNGSGPRVTSEWRVQRKATGMI